MEFTKVGLAIAAAACVTAGAAASYLVTRPGTTDAPGAPVEAAVSPDPGGVPVEQSEAIVHEPALEEARRPEPVASPRPATVPARRVAPPAPRPASPAPRPVIEPTVPEPAEVVAIAPAPIEPLPPLELESVAPPAPAVPEFEELVLSTDSVIGLSIETAVSSETASVEDEVIARVTRDVKVGDRVAVPAGSKVHGEVTVVEPGGRMRERARLGVRFTSIVLADGITRIPIDTETIYREGDAPGRESATKIGGGAIGGAIIGGILGGAKGAAIGGSIGAGAGSAAVLAGGRNPATLSQGAPVTVRLQDEARIVVD